MLKVTNSKKIEIKFIPAHNDMGHLYPSYFAVSGDNWFYMELHEYMDKREFERFPKPPKDSELTEEEKTWAKNYKGEKIEHEQALAYMLLGNKLGKYAYDMTKLLEQAGGKLWQFNAVNKNLDGYV
jgi:hypothetical protein